MVSITASKIIGPESSALCFIQTWWHVIASFIFFISFILKTVRTQTTTDFGKYERFLTHWWFCEMYNPTEHLALDEVIVLYKWRIVFRQYVPKKHKRFGIRIYKLCNFLGCTYDMSVYLGKQWHHATALLLLWGLMACYSVNCTFAFTFTFTIRFVISFCTQLRNWQKMHVVWHWSRN